MSKNSSNTGLIIGLAFALTLLVLLAAIYILRRHRKGDLFFFGIKRKGSKISMSRGNSGNSDIGNIESGYGHITSETVNNTEAVAVINDSQSSTSISQTTSHEQTPSEAAEDAAWGLMSSGYSANVTSTSRSTEPSYVAAKVLPRDTNQIGTILVDIPEVSETSESHLSEVDFFENENGEAVSVTNNSVSGGGELPRASTITLGQQLVHTTIESSKPTKRKKSRLHRAVSTASSKLAFWSTESKEKTRLGRVGSTTSTSTSSRHFPAGFKITSDPNAPPHIQNIQRASSNPNRSVIATIRPEHHQQLLRQIQLEQDIDTEEQSDQDSGSSRDMPRYPLVLKSSGKQYSGFDQQSGIGLVSSKDAFVNPGPPPLPPPARSRSNLHINIKSGASSNLKRGLTQPAHARTQRSRAAPTAEEHAAKSGAHNPGLYGYM
ncbi:hypothetical protein BGZ76_002461 [Entomortierella beljakovae]|nr:hypothetical protein BGZ76_002461 [Entomortierella beljakovae]